jgi:putative nucleotidyltransferase with HDIG domain
MELAEARALVREKTDKDITVRHLISVEGVMRTLARRLGEDEHGWALAGLFHDLDQDQTGEDPERHAYLAAEWLREAGVEEPVVNAVLAHAHEQYRTDLMSKAVVHADAIAGLLVAAGPGPPGAVGGHEGVVDQEEAEGEGVRARREPRRGVRGGADPGAAAGRVHCRGDRGDPAGRPRHRAVGRRHEPGGR